MPVDQRFFRIVDDITVTDLAARLGAVLHGQMRQHPITGVAPLAETGNGDGTFQTSAIMAGGAPPLFFLKGPFILRRAPGSLPIACCLSRLFLIYFLFF